METTLFYPYCICDIPLDCKFTDGTWPLRYTTIIKNHSWSGHKPELTGQVTNLSYPHKRKKDSNHLPSYFKHSKTCSVVREYTAITSSSSYIRHRLTSLVSQWMTAMYMWYNQILHNQSFMTALHCRYILCYVLRSVSFVEWSIRPSIHLPPCAYGAHWRVHYCSDDHTITWRTNIHNPYRWYLVCGFSADTKKLYIWSE